MPPVSNSHDVICCISLKESESNYSRGFHFALNQHGDLSCARCSDVGSTPHLTVAANSDVFGRPIPSDTAGSPIFEWYCTRSDEKLPPYSRLLELLKDVTDGKLH